MANNLPSNLKRHTMFRDKPYTHKVNFPDNFVMPSVITAEVRKSNRVLPGIAPTVEKDGQSFTFTYQPEILKKIEGLYDHYFLFDGHQFLGGQINSLVSYGDPDGGETSVIIAGDSITTIQIPGSELAAQALEQVTQLTNQNIDLANQVAEDKQTTITKASEASSSALTAEQERGAAEDAADGAIAAKNQANQIKSETNQIKTDTAAIRDQVLEVQMQIDEGKRIRVPTYAAMVAQLINETPRKYRVTADETQINEDTGIPEPYVLYTWDGQILYMYDIYPKNPQPIVNN